MLWLGVGWASAWGGLVSRWVSAWLSGVVMCDGGCSCYYVTYLVVFAGVTGPSRDFVLSTDAAAYHHYP